MLRELERPARQLRHRGLKPPQNSLRSRRHLGGSSSFPLLIIPTGLFTTTTTFALPGAASSAPSSLALIITNIDDQTQSAGTFNIPSVTVNGPPNRSVPVGPSSGGGRYQHKIWIYKPLSTDTSVTFTCSGFGSNTKCKALMVFFPSLGALLSGSGAVGYRSTGFAGPAGGGVGVTVQLNVTAPTYVAGDVSLFVGWEDCGSTGFEAASGKPFIVSGSSPTTQVFSDFINLESWVIGYSTGGATVKYQRGSNVSQPPGITDNISGWSIALDHL